MINSAKLLNKANKENYAVGAFNINNLEVLKAVVNAASKLKAPVILQTSENAIKYAGLNYLFNMIKAVDNVEYALHLDHGKELKLIKKCINLGYTSVMFDGSGLKFNDNVRKTKYVVSLAKKKNVSVEAELGMLGNNESFYTNPDQAKEFVEKTGINSLAISIGTSHGVYKFKNKPSLRFDILKEIKNKTKMPLVLHGASNVPDSITSKLNKLGLKLKNTQGVPDDQIKKAINLGINKVNIDTDLRLAFNLGLRKSLNNLDPREMLKPAINEMQKLAEHKIILFGSMGKSK